MRHGFIKASAATPQIRLADCNYNADLILENIKIASEDGVHLVVFPELTVTGATCQDLFFQTALTDEALSESLKIAALVPRNIIAVWGLPFIFNGRLYNCAMAASDGHVIGIIPQSKPCRGFERWFSAWDCENVKTQVGDDEVLFGNRQILCCESLREFKIFCEIGTDFYLPVSPDSKAALSGASVIACLSADNSLPGNGKERKALMAAKSIELKSGLVCSTSGRGESTTDLVFTAENFVFEEGECLAESSLDEGSLLTSEIDVKKLETSRRLSGLFETKACNDFAFIGFEIEMGETLLTRKISRNPFIPEDDDEREIICSETLRLQALGLVHRIKHINAKTVVLGLSGGLDSTLALLVAVTSFDIMQKDRKDILCVTLPCFGTTEKTKNNAVVLAQTLGCSISTVDIGKAVKQHFEDIGHDPDKIDAAYENAQARERTQVLMDMANMYNGLVVGTGDLSELALGWATFNGDHMSMYAVNASVPKTMVKAVVKYYADNSDNEVLIETLYSILATPISPELVPGQVTEDLVGPYELHDFFLYNILKWGSTPGKIFRLAKYVFDGQYDDSTIEKWLRTFIRRFFAQQFKRSCSADGPKAGPLSLSPRGDWHMPSDANSPAWTRELDFSLD